MIRAIDNPLFGTFEKNAAAVFELHSLPLDRVPAYVAAFRARDRATRHEMDGMPAIEAFGTVHRLAIEDALGTEHVTDAKTLRRVRDDLWLTITGINPRVYHTEETAAAKRLKALGIERP